MSPLNFSWSNRQQESTETMDSFTYYDTKKAESLKNSCFQIIRGRYEDYRVYGLDIGEQQDFFNQLCKKICYEYRQNGTSTFVKAMQDAVDQRAEHNFTLSPFEISVLREAKKRLDAGCYDGLNMREFQSSILIPHIHEKNECYWYNKIIHEPWTQRKIAYLEIFDIENKHRIKSNSLNNRISTADISAAPNQSQASDFSAATTDDAELKKAEAKIKELQEQIQRLQKANESERLSVIDLANEEAAKIRMAAVAEAEKIKAAVEAEATKLKAAAEAEAAGIKARAEEAAAEAEAKAQTIFKNKLSKKILDQRAKTRDTNIDGIKSEIKKYYAKPADLSRNNNFIEKSASDLQNIFSTVMNEAIEKLKEEKAQMYEQMDKLRHDIYPSKEKLCIKWYLDYYGTWNKTGDTVIAALLSNLEANSDLDPDNKITGNLIKLSGMLEKFMVEFENAIAALGFEVFRPEVGDRYNSNEHRCSDQSDEDDTDDFNGRRILACKKPGIKRIGLSGQEEVLEFAEVIVEE